MSDAVQAFERWQARWTPEAMSARAAEERAERGQVREASPLAELTLDALWEKLGFSREYAEHLVQPYCSCECGHDGWQYCQHANDLGWPDREWIR
ncbi:hypothetical protein [Actinoplanes italicus]|uniref:Uncharacterized protein n=1 Tax=Actinoplanes italicus TaxID=113567 RepID=A0A2T0KJH6_9ACTN|nr:hypothetical protein [Actinoplanes italicus]PRX23681.1 hypothetical protein CLV67_103430 [Actinoplanes italicus]